MKAHLIYKSKFEVYKAPRKNLEYELSLEKEENA